LVEAKQWLQAGLEILNRRRNLMDTKYKKDEMNEILKEAHEEFSLVTRGGFKKPH